MTESKPWWQSKTIWGAAIAFGAPLAAKVFHVNFTPESQSALTDWIVGSASAFGGLLAIIGRIKADSKIGS